MKAMILAAGRGERMQPLTAHTPKPLMSVGDTTLIEHVLMAIKDAGILDVVINVHHLKDHITRYCGDGSQYGLSIRYTIEETLLDTGGGIFNALPLLGDSPFVVLSADVWTDYPLSKLVKRSTHVAHVVLVDNPEFHPSGDFGLDALGIVHSVDATQLTYANMALLHPRLFSRETAGIFPLSRVLRAAVQTGLVTGEHYHGAWYNVGTVRDLILLRRSAMRTFKNSQSIRM